MRLTGPSHRGTVLANTKNGFPLGFYQSFDLALADEGQAIVASARRCS
jgi:hypothetical protein